MVFFEGLKEGELVHLSPLTEAENLNLEEAVVNKGRVELGDPVDKETLKSVEKKDEPVDFGLSEEQREKWDVARTKAKDGITEVIKKIQSREIQKEKAGAALKQAFDNARAEVEIFLNEAQLKKYDAWIIPTKKAAGGKMKRFLTPASPLGDSASGQRRRSRN